LAGFGDGSLEVGGVSLGRRLKLHDGRDDGAVRAKAAADGIDGADLVGWLAWIKIRDDDVERRRGRAAVGDEPMDVVSLARHGGDIANPGDVVARGPDDHCVLFIANAVEVAHAESAGNDHVCGDHVAAPVRGNDVLGLKIEERRGVIETARFAIGVEEADVAVWRDRCASQWARA